MPAGTTVTPPAAPSKTTQQRLPRVDPPRTPADAPANSIRPFTLAQIVATRLVYDNTVRLPMAELAKEGKEQTIGGVSVTFSESGPGGKDKAPDGFVFAKFAGKDEKGNPTEASVLIHKASGDLCKLKKEGETSATVSISAHEQKAFNPFFSQMREGLKELSAKRENERATKVSEGLQPVKEGKAPHLAELAKDVGDQGGSMTTGRVTVRSEGPAEGEAKPGAVPADHHRLTIEVQPSAQAGSTPATPRVLSLLIEDKTGKVTGSTIGGKTASEQEVNAFLNEAQRAAKPLPTATTQRTTDTSQAGGASTPYKLTPEQSLAAYGKFAKPGLVAGLTPQVWKVGRSSVRLGDPMVSKRNRGGGFFLLRNRPETLWWLTSTKQAM